MFRRNAPKCVHSKAYRPLCMYLCVAVTADRHEVGRIERDAWVAYVVGCEMHDVMHRVGRCVQSALEALLTQSPAL